VKESGVYLFFLEWNLKPEKVGRQSEGEQTQERAAALTSKRKGPPFLPYEEISTTAPFSSLFTFDTASSKRPDALNSFSMPWPDSSLSPRNLFYWR